MFDLGGRLRRHSWLAGFVCASAVLGIAANSLSWAMWEGSAVLQEMVFSSGDWFTLGEEKTPIPDEILLEPAISTNCAPAWRGSVATGSAEANISIAPDLLVITANESGAVSFSLSPECQEDSTLVFDVTSRHGDQIASAAGAFRGGTKLTSIFAWESTASARLVLERKFPFEAKITFFEAGDQVTLSNWHFENPPAFPLTSALQDRNYDLTYASWKKLPAKSDSTATISAVWDATKNQWPSGCHTRASLWFPEISSWQCEFWSGDEVFLPASASGILTQVPGNSDAARWRAARPLTSPTKKGDLLISEVMWAGSYHNEMANSYDEWIELYNPTEVALNLTGIKIEGARSGGGTISLDADANIGPYGYFLIGRRSGTGTELTRGPDYVHSSFSLSNDSARLVLKTENNAVLDETPSGAWQAGINNTAQHIRASAQRQFPLSPEETIQLVNETPDWSQWYHCDPASSVSTCTQFGQQNWRSPPGQNLATPWQANGM